MKSGRSPSELASEALDEAEKKKAAEAAAPELEQ
jgi:hypothetical protein